MPTLNQHQIVCDHFQMRHRLICNSPKSSSLSRYGQYILTSDECKLYRISRIKKHRIFSRKHRIPISRITISLHTHLGFLLFITYFTREGSRFVPKLTWRDDKTAWVRKQNPSAGRNSCISTSQLKITERCGNVRAQRSTATLFDARNSHSDFADSGGQLARARVRLSFHWKPGEKWRVVLVRGPLSPPVYCHVNKCKRTHVTHVTRPELAWEVSSRRCMRSRARERMHRAVLYGSSYSWRFHARTYVPVTVAGGGSARAEMYRWKTQREFSAVQRTGRDAL